MKINLFEKKETEKVKPSFSINYSRIKNVTEQAKGVIDNKEKFKEKDVGKEHIENYDENELLVKRVPIINGIIDKTVDFTVGQGYYVRSDNEQAVKICNEFMKKMNFDLFLRKVVKNMLVYGNAYVEIIKGETSELDALNLIQKRMVITGLKNWSPKNFFIKVDEHGDTIGYTQYYNMSSKISFTNDEIAHFALNPIGENPYGLSIIEPMRVSIKDKLKLEKDMVGLMGKKANVPYVFKLGTEENPASATDINNFACDLQYLTNRNEWVFSHAVDVSTVDFGQIGEKFFNIFNHYENQIIYAGQVPHVLLGKANVPEGLAVAQKDAFDLRIESIRAVVEEIIEKDIFALLLKSKGIIDSVEFNWGTNENKEKQAQVLMSIISPMSGFQEQTRLDAENKLRDLIGFEGKVVTQVSFNPFVPKEQPAASFYPIAQSVKGEEGYNITESFVGFELRPFMEYIIKYLMNRNFENVSTVDKIFLERMRTVLMAGIKKGESISSMIRKLTSNTNVNSLEAERIVRTEIIKASNQGAISAYEDSGMVKEVEWLTAEDERICPVCNSLDRKKMSFNEARNLIEGIHPNCRCTIIPVI